jgi:hypothetical protein
MRAIHISFADAVLGLGVVNGDIVIAQSFAELSAIPEPGTAALLAFGTVLLGVAGRGR